MKSLQYTVSKEEREDYITRYFSGETELRDQVIVSNVPLVGYIVRNKFPFTDNNDIEDLMSIGIIGLIKAVDNFDAEKGYRFITFASRVIYNEIAMELRKTARKKRKQDILSLDAPIVDCNTGESTGECTLSDIIPDRNFNLESRVEERILFEQARDMTGNMKKLMREVVQKRYFEVDQVAQKDLAQELNVAQSYVSRLEKRGINFLKGAFGA